MLNKYLSKTKQRKVFIKTYNIALLKIPLTSFFKRRGQGKSKSYNTWQSPLNALLKIDLAHMQMTSAFFKN